MNEIARLKRCFDRLVDGGRLALHATKVGEDAKFEIAYKPVETGKTDAGVEWFNVHKGYRENAMRSIRDRALPWLKGSGVDFGCGLEKITPDCVGIDTGEDYKERTAQDFDDFSKVIGEFDWVFSSNALEHIEDWEKALDDCVRFLVPGGIIFLYLPWPDKCYLHSSAETPNHKWNPSPLILWKELEKRNVEVVECDEDEDRWGCFVIVGRKRG